MKRALFASLCLTFSFACDAGESEASTTEAETSSGDGDGDATGDGDGDGTTDSTDTLPTGETTDTDGPLEPVGSIVGITLDEAGVPLPTPGLQFCGPVIGDGIPDLCISFDVEADGSFLIEPPKVGIWNLKVVHGDVDGRKFGGQAFQIEVNEGDELDISDSPIIVPEVSSTTALTEDGGEQTVEIEGGLSVSLDPALAQSPSFGAPTELGGRLVDPAFYRYADIDGEPIVAAWSFTPFGIKAKEGSFTVSFTDALGLEASSAVKVYELSKDNGGAYHIGDGTVNGDATGIDVTGVGDGLHELSWIIVTQ